MVDFSKELKDKIIAVLSIAGQELRASAPWFDQSAKKDILSSAQSCEDLIKEIEEIPE